MKFLLNQQEDGEIQSQLQSVWKCFKGTKLTEEIIWVQKVEVETNEWKKIKLQSYSSSQYNHCSSSSKSKWRAKV